MFRILTIFVKCLRTKSMTDVLFQTENRRLLLLFHLIFEHK